jgi:hypothetical protein
LEDTEEEGILVEEEEDRLYVTIVINQEIYHATTRIYVQHAHTIEHWTMRENIVLN